MFAVKEWNNLLSSSFFFFFQLLDEIKFMLLLINSYELERGLIEIAISETNSCIERISIFPDNNNKASIIIVKRSDNQVKVASSIWPQLQAAPLAMYWVILVQLPLSCQLVNYFTLSDLCGCCWDEFICLPVLFQTADRAEWVVKESVTSGTHTNIKQNKIK